MSRNVTTMYRNITTYDIDVDITLAGKKYSHVKVNDIVTAIDDRSVNEYVASHLNTLIGADLTNVSSDDGTSDFSVSINSIEKHHRRYVMSTQMYVNLTASTALDI